MNESRIVNIARRQLADYDAHRPGRIFADAGFTLTLSEAFEVQRQISTLRIARGEAITGYKIGCLSEAVQRQLGLYQPAFGYLYASELYGSGAVLSAGVFDHLAIEGEFAVRLGVDLTVVSVFPVIELHNYVFRAATPTAPELIANNALHAGLVLPHDEISHPSSRELMQATLTVFRNGELLGTAQSGAVPGGPLGSIAKITEHLARTEATLQPGQIILTGSPLPLYPVQPGDQVVVRGPESTEVELFVRG